MSDNVLKTSCILTIESMKRITEMLDDGTDETGQEGDAMAKALTPLLQSIIATPALTWAGCAAKAALYLSFTRDDIGLSLADDVMRLAGFAT